jgi:RNA polymerase sigma factor (sigma-70 family)
MIPNETHNEQYFASDVDRAARALESLEAGQREVLVMGVVQGMTHSEIALATGKPLGTVKTQLRRGLSKVRAMLEAGVELEVKEADE